MEEEPSTSDQPTTPQAEVLAEAISNETIVDPGNIQLQGLLLNSLPQWWAKRLTRPSQWPWNTSWQLADKALSNMMDKYETLANCKVMVALKVNLPIWESMKLHACNRHKAAENTEGTCKRSHSLLTRSHISYWRPTEWSNLSSSSTFWDKHALQRAHQARPQTKGSPNCINPPFQWLETCSTMTCQNILRTLPKSTKLQVKSRGQQGTPPYGNSFSRWWGYSRGWSFLVQGLPRQGRYNTYNNNYN